MAGGRRQKLLDAVALGSQACLELRDGGVEMHLGAGKTGVSCGVLSSAAQSTCRLNKYDNAHKPRHQLSPPLCHTTLATRTSSTAGREWCSLKTSATSETRPATAAGSETETGEASRWRL